ncbi:MAG: 30S ribosome-binding factor RbfA [Nostocoides sp.]
MADAARALKIADRIKVVTAANLGQLVKDPDLGMVTFTDARVTNDLQHATLFYTVLGDQDQRERTAAILDRHKGKIRSFVGQQIGIRLTPTLEFVPDALPENASHIEDLLRAAKAHDAQVAAAAASAGYAGDVDPYKKVPDDADGDTASA